MKKRVFIAVLLVLAAAGLLAYLFREPILKKAGLFMTPGGDYKADVVILEGTDYIPAGLVHKGMDLLSSGKVSKMILVMQRIDPAHRLFGLEGDYPDLVRQKLKEAGIKEGQYEIISFPVQHPITLTEAKHVLKRLATEKISSAILVAESYHTRRSYMIYSYVGEPMKIKIYPVACFTQRHSDKWWMNDREWRDFGTESAKLTYYLVFGHIPFKFSY